VKKKAGQPNPAAALIAQFGPTHPVLGQTLEHSGSELPRSEHSGSGHSGSEHSGLDRSPPQHLHGKQFAIVAASPASGSFAPYRDALRTALVAKGAQVVRYEISNDETIRSVLRQRPEITFVDDSAETSRFSNTVRALWPQAVFVVLTAERTANSLAVAKGHSTDQKPSTAWSPVSSLGSAPSLTPRLCIHDVVANIETLTTQLLRSENVERSSNEQPENSADELSIREVEILRGVVHGFSLDEIASRIFVAPKTLNNQLTTIYRKLRVSGLTQAVISALRLGLIDLNEQ
jgi:DNA-binding CsgD family transcriptional regulator